MVLMIGLALMRLASHSLTYPDNRASPCESIPRRSADNNTSVASLASASGQPIFLNTDNAKACSDSKGYIFSVMAAKIIRLVQKSLPFRCGFCIVLASDIENLRSMKRILFLLVLIGVGTAGYAQTDKPVDSKINRVTVFLNRAQVTREIKTRV